MKFNTRCFLDIKIGDAEAERVVVELFDEKCPKACDNFKKLCQGVCGLGMRSNKPLHYQGCIFHRIIKGFIIQGGDFSKGDGTGGESIYGSTFADENMSVPHDRPFLLSMANRGPNTNGSQFFITTAAAPHLNGKNMVFGHVLSGKEVVAKMDAVPVADTRTHKPIVSVVIDNCGELVPVKKKKSKNLAKELKKKNKRGKKLRKKRKKKARKASQSSTSDSDESDSVKIRPEEIPEVPKNKFLYRGDPDCATNNEQVVQNRSCNWKTIDYKSSRKVKGRGELRYRTPNSRTGSRDRSITPIHWRQATQRTRRMSPEDVRKWHERRFDEKTRKRQVEGESRNGHPDRRSSLADEDEADPSSRRRRRRRSARHDHSSESRNRSPSPAPDTNRAIARAISLKQRSPITHDNGPHKRQRDSSSPPGREASTSDHAGQPQGPVVLTNALRPLIDYSPVEDSRGCSADINSSPSPRRRVGNDKRQRCSPPTHRSVTRDQDDKFVINVSRRYQEPEQQPKRPPSSPRRTRPSSTASSHEQRRFQEKSPLTLPAEQSPLRCCDCKRRLQGAPNNRSRPQKSPSSRDTTTDQRLLSHAMPTGTAREQHRVGVSPSHRTSPVASPGTLSDTDQPPPRRRGSRGPPRSPPPHLVKQWRERRVLAQAKQECRRSTQSHKYLDIPSPSPRTIPSPPPRTICPAVAAATPTDLTAKPHPRSFSSSLSPSSSSSTSSGSSPSTSSRPTKKHELTHKDATKNTIGGKETLAAAPKKKKNKRKTPSPSPREKSPEGPSAELPKVVDNESEPSTLQKTDTDLNRTLIGDVVANVSKWEGSPGAEAPATSNVDDEAAGGRKSPDLSVGPWTTRRWLDTTTNDSEVRQTTETSQRMASPTTATSTTNISPVKMTLVGASNPVAKTASASGAVDMDVSDADDEKGAKKKLQVDGLPSGAALSYLPPATANGQTIPAAVAALASRTPGRSTRGRRRSRSYSSRSPYTSSRSSTSSYSSSRSRSRGPRRRHHKRRSGRRRSSSRGGSYRRRGGSGGRSRSSFSRGRRGTATTASSRRRSRSYSQRRRGGRRRSTSRSYSSSSRSRSSSRGSSRR